MTQFYHTKYDWIISHTPTPADLCIQSVVKRDAGGWHQRCSCVRLQVPLLAPVGQMEKQHIAEVGGDRETGKKDIVDPDEDIGFLAIATPGDVVEPT